MDYAIALAAASAAMLCNGTGVILEKLGVDRQENGHDADAALAPKLLGDKYYMAGIILDIGGWLLTLLAVRTLPLFLVQSIISANIVVTALLDQVLLKRRLPLQGYGLIGLVVAGLTLLAISAPPQGVDRDLTAGAIWIGVLILVAVCILAALVWRLPATVSAISLSVLTGITFAGAAIASRLLVNNLNFIQFLLNPLTYVLIAAAIIGTAMFTVALGRSSATLVNAVTLSMQTIVPAVLGIVILGDHVRPGMTPIVVVAMTITLCGSLALGGLRKQQTTVGTAKAA